MLFFLPALIRIPLVVLLLILNVVVHILPLFVLALIKFLLPLAEFRRLCSRGLALIAENYASVNNAMFILFTRTRWHIAGMESILFRHNSYLILCNHQSWVDIPVLLKLFNRRVPFLRFFIKQQLKWVPLLGLAWWALDFPFMKRYSRATLARRPELRGRDRESTRRACAKFKHIPVTVVNFAEGTRFTQAKHDAQGSPYHHLLRARAGGLASSFDAMGNSLHAILDVTIVYADGAPSMADLLAGRIRDIRVHVHERSIEASLYGDYENDKFFRKHFCNWVNALWRSKGAKIEHMLATPTAKLE